MPGFLEAGSVLLELQILAVVVAVEAPQTLPEITQAALAAPALSFFATQSLFRP